MHRGDQAGHGAARPHGPAAVRRRGLRQDGGGLPGHDEVRPGRQTGRRAGAHHRPGPAALPHRPAAVCQVPGDHRRGLPLPHPRPDEGDPAQGGDRGGGHPHRHPPAVQPGRAVQGPGPAGGGRGAALRGGAQGEAEGELSTGGRAHPVRHPHPPDPEHGPVRHPGHVHPGGAPRRPPAGADLRAGARLARPGRRHAPGAGAGRAGLLPPQPGGDHRPHRRPHPEMLGEDAAVGVAHGRDAPGGHRRRDEPA